MGAINNPNMTHSEARKAVAKTQELSLDPFLNSKNGSKSYHLAYTNIIFCF